MYPIIFLCFFSQKNVRIKRSGIKVHYKKHIYFMDTLLSKDWKCATYQKRVYDFLTFHHPKIRIYSDVCFLKYACNFKNLSLHVH